jgi:hypothetical protein
MRIDAIIGNEEIDVGIALAVTMRGHVDRHAVDRDGEIGAVVEVEAAQEILVGFALAAVLRDDQARDSFKEFAGTGGGLCVDTRTHAGLFAGAVFGSGPISGRGDSRAFRRRGDVDRDGEYGRRWCCG